ncbi:DUF4279 domain-containing protein [Paraglaciecola mesophila]|nr:DUF4279 domain-containing protein [Paraglaciecola mesophila]
MLEKIINILGEPTNGFSKGQEFGKSKKLRPHTQWNLEIDFGNSNMQACINEILGFYNANDLSVINSECEADIFCMASSDNGQGSFTLDAEIYQKLVEARLNITFDFYSD